MLLRVHVIDKTNKIIMLFPVLIFLISIIIDISYCIKYNLIYSNKIKYELNILKQNSDTIEVVFDGFNSDRIKLQKNKIKFRAISNANINEKYKNTIFGHETIRHNNYLLYSRLNTISQ